MRQDGHDEIAVRKPACPVRVGPCPPFNRQSVDYMNLRIVSSPKSPASPISTSFHFSLPANTFHQPPRILT